MRFHSTTLYLCLIFVMVAWCAYSYTHWILFLISEFILHIKSNWCVWVCETVLLFQSNRQVASQNPHICKISGKGYGICIGIAMFSVLLFCVSHSVSECSPQNIFASFYSSVHALTSFIALLLCTVHTFHISNFWSTFSIVYFYCINTCISSLSLSLFVAISPMFVFTFRILLLYYMSLCCYCYS